MSNVTILIAGAGPVGLTAALQLSHLLSTPDHPTNITLEIIDKAPGPIPPSQSRALGIHARTLELLPDDVTKSLLEQGIIGRGAAFHLPDGTTFQMEIEGVLKDVTEFPYMLLIAQGTTERVLCEVLESKGIWVRRNTAVVGVRQEVEGIVCELEITNPSDGRVVDKRVVVADYVIACDGAHSAVRKSLGVPLQREDKLGAVFHMMDAEISLKEGCEGLLKKDYLNAYPGSEYILMLIPVPDKSNNLWRIITNRGLESFFTTKKENERLQVTKPFFVDTLQSTFPGADLGDPRWITSFKIWERLISNMRYGNVFFAGDAAHTHSPAGGQGIGIGIQDAVNIAWKLSMVLKKQANPWILKTYDQERRHVVKPLLQRTTMITNMMNFKRWPFWWIRNLIMGLVFKFDVLKRFAVLANAQLLYSYTTSGSALVVGQAANAGKRAPNPVVEAVQDGAIYATRIYNVYKQPQHECNFHVLFWVPTVLSGMSGGVLGDKFETVNKVMVDWKHRYGDVVRFVVMFPVECKATHLPFIIEMLERKDVALDAVFCSREACLGLGMPVVKENESCLVSVVRPDLHVGCDWTGLSESEVVGRWLGSFIL
ncbi:hypothetical protein HDU76_008649 [Blyttiomyces sp. JEL0837]|nr:hypothetical protein HDU76_008649 [Blyttiomyces sp. JEL0837]